MTAKPSSKLTDAKVQETTTLAEQMFENYEKKILDLNNQLKFIQIINSTLDLEKMVKTLLFSSQGNMLVSGVAIFLPTDLEDTSFCLRDCVGYESDSYNICIETNSAFIKLLQKVNNYIKFETITSEKKYKSVAEQLSCLSPDIIVPLKSKENFIGFLIFGRKLSGKDFTNSEYEFIASIGEASGIAMENARLYEMATQDRMSGLFIHHYFKNRLLEEFQRAKRYRSSLALMMIDIDHFKEINDNYGHQKGDMVIKDFALIIKDGIRHIDLAARYGGEEFAIILPGTNISSAKSAAERLRKKIENHKFIDPKNPIKITASIGISILNKEISSSEKLIEQADKALYKSKRNGRNKVTVYKA